MNRFVSVRSKVHEKRKETQRERERKKRRGEMQITLKGRKKGRRESGVSSFTHTWPDDRVRKGKVKTTRLTNAYIHLDCPGGFILLCLSSLTLLASESCTREEGREESRKKCKTHESDFDSRNG